MTTAADCQHLPPPADRHTFGWGMHKAYEKHVAHLHGADRERYEELSHSRYRLRPDQPCKRCGDVLSPQDQRELLDLMAKANTARSKAEEASKGPGPALPPEGAYNRGLQYLGSIPPLGHSGR